MSFSIGLDIGGTKIAAASFAADGTEIQQLVEPTPDRYDALLTRCAQMVGELDRLCGAPASVGIGLPGAVRRQMDALPLIANIPCLSGQPLRGDLGTLLNRPLALANDANCAALSEAIDGAGAGYTNVFGLIMGTGAGGGFVVNGQIIEGANGLAGEIGHLPLPHRDKTDGPLAPCNCGQQGCIDKTISGAALSRLYKDMTGEDADTMQIVEDARRGPGAALKVLDAFYATVAKAMVTIIHAYDPDVIVVSGGLNSLPGLYTNVPRRWGKYCLVKDIKTKLVPAKFGAMSGLRGAAKLGLRAATH